MIMARFNLLGVALLLIEVMSISLATSCHNDHECSTVQCSVPGASSFCNQGECACPLCDSDADCPLPCPFRFTGHCNQGNCTCRVILSGRRLLQPCTNDTPCYMPCPFGQVGHCDEGTCKCQIQCKPDICRIKCPTGVCMNGACDCNATCTRNTECANVYCYANQTGFCNLGHCDCHIPCTDDKDCPLPCPYPQSGYCDQYGSCRCH
ncbi:scavenger receptor class F member 1-like [Mya arenaria]|uniref:scavenger receptor class F member 1-like n=1 Tax=Mya arenaria TaxID=6604 RepID=UPI0022E4BEA5|nr:scavenger receptor class F member 1-like [Mya arenaria]